MERQAHHAAVKPRQKEKRLSFGDGRGSYRQAQTANVRENGAERRRVSEGLTAMMEVFHVL
jgi:hypothetical protein